MLGLLEAYGVERSSDLNSNAIDDSDGRFLETRRTIGTVCTCFLFLNII